MRDIDLWRALTSGADPRSIVSELRELATQPLPARSAFLPYIEPLARDGDADVRAAAVSNLAGVLGMRGLRTIVAALDDEDPRVRAAALHALGRSGVDEPLRFVHAFFHRRQDVRLQALQLPPPNAAAGIGAYLRADPVCRELASQGPWPSSALNLALDLYRRGGVTAAELAERVVQSPPAQIRAQLGAEPGRTADEINGYLAHAQRSTQLEAPPRRDALAPLVRALATLGSTELADRAVAQLASTVVVRKPGSLTRRVQVELLGLAADDALTPPLVQLLVAIDPRVIGYGFFRRELAATAASGLLRFRSAHRPPADQIRKLLARPIFVREGGEPDLLLAAAVAWMLPGTRLAQLQAQFGVDAITAALMTDDAGWASICTLPGESPALERTWMLAIGKRSPTRFQELAAIALATFSREPARCRELADWLPRDVRAPALLTLARKLCDGDLSLTDKRLANIGRALGNRLSNRDVLAVLGELCGTGEPARLALAIKLARQLPEKMLTSAVERMHADSLLALLNAITPENRLPWARELSIARVLTHHANPDLAAWAERVRAALRTKKQTPKPTIAPARALSQAEYDRITSCAQANLPKALEPALSAPCTGLAGALGERAAPPTPHLTACAALLACADALVDVAVQLERFGDDDEHFDSRLDGAAMRWLERMDVPALAHAQLFRWERHKLQVIEWMVGRGGVMAALHSIGLLPAGIARRSLWRAVASGVQLLRYRDKPRLRALVTGEAGAFFAGEVDQPWGRYAASILISLVEAGSLGDQLDSLRELVLERAPDTDAETRDYLRQFVRLEGVPQAALPAAEARVRPDELAEIRQSTDGAVLTAACRKPRRILVEEAVLRLIEIGREDCLAALARELRLLPCPVPIIESIPLWESADALDTVAAIARDHETDGRVRFHLSVALLERGDDGVADLAEHALAAACEPAEPSWFRRADWNKLITVVPPDACALALARSPHHHAYTPAVKHLLAREELTDAHGDALRSFLEAGTTRPLEIRRRVARHLMLHREDEIGMPVLLNQIVEGGNRSAPIHHALPRREVKRMCERVAEIALVGGRPVCTEDRMIEVLSVVAGHVLVDTWTAVLHGARTSNARQKAALFLSTAHDKGARMRKVADVFAWGVKRSVELTGKLYRVHMTSGEHDLGHTFLNEKRIFVSPLPLLRDEPHGRDIVEGLILHELGHHLYHTGERAKDTWARAQREGLHHLLNLVADEHLERNLRAVDARFGDRIKRLDAYAFKHASQEISVERLLRSLRAAAVDALLAIPLDVAFEGDCVRIRRGRVLGELAKRGHPLARFSRALRMGLGNREKDPIVAEALALFDRGFRHLDMPALYEVTRALASMFGGATAVADVFGGSEGLTWGDRDGDIYAGGFDDDALQREVERILDPRKNRSPHSRGGGRLAINVSEEEQFDRIDRIERVRGDRGAYQEIAAGVRRHAGRLRQFLDDLGLRWLPVGARVQGRALDRTRLRPLVIRRDPRILLARQPRRYSDLFIGVAVDCSGSMQVGESMPRAKQFAVLLAEATRPLRGVDVRFFGFTDSLIYDAGNQHDVDVTALEAGGGNNDAAALLHAAEAAARSKRRAKVLVMISDGLPTECSVAALRGLVQELGRRRGMLCAQVAVRPLEEVCFPHYVVIDDESIDVSVARFGRIIADLASRSMRAS